MTTTTATQETCMRILFTGKNQLKLDRTPLHEPGPNEVLVNTAWSLISTGTELTCLHRRFAPGTHWDGWVRYPFQAGYSCAGTITAIGSGVTDWAVGDRVACNAHHASVNLVTARELRHVPGTVPLRDAAWLALLKIVQIGFRTAEHRLGDRVVVVGCGILGQLLVQYLRLAGCQRIVAVDREPTRLDHARTHGATHVVAGNADAHRQAILDAAAGPPDVVYDVTGAPSVLPACLALPRDFGAVVLLGDVGEPHLQHLTPDVVIRGVRLKGAHVTHPTREGLPMHPWGIPEIENYAMTLLASGELQVGDLISHTFTPDQARAAYDLAADPERPNMGILFQWT